MLASRIRRVSSDGHRGALDGGRLSRAGACVLGAIALLAAGAAACGDDTTTDTDAEVDGGASTVHDAGLADAARSDGGESIDAALDAVDGDATPPVDPCAAKAAACPTAPAGFSEASGLAPIDRCAFPLKKGVAFASSGALMKALEGVATHVTTATVLADLNRTGVATKTAPGAPARRRDRVRVGRGG